MNRATEQPRRDRQSRSREASLPPPITRAATSSPRNELPRGQHTNASSGVKSPRTTKRAAGKQRKRSRSEMTTLSLDDSMDGHDALRNSPSKRSRPSLPESQHFTHSDEDDDAVRFSVPPPPPSQPVPAELVCRYPNKPCPQERATKKHGELHSYCAYHRFKAQQYQRKLEQKKRERRLREERSPSALLAATTLGGDGGSGRTSSSDGMLLRGLALEQGVSALFHHSSPPKKALSPPVRRQSGRPRTKSSPPRPSGAMSAGLRMAETSRRPSSHQPTNPAVGGPETTSTLEPFHHPVSLQEGDLQLLQVFLWDPETDLSGQPGRSRTASVDPRLYPAAMSISRDCADGGDAYNVNLDGFTFTSESL